MKKRVPKKRPQKVTHSSFELINQNTKMQACSPVCAALGYGPQAEFDEQVARKDAEVRRRLLRPRLRRFFFCIVVIVVVFVFFLRAKRSSSSRGAQRSRELFFQFETMRDALCW